METTWNIIVAQSPFEAKIAGDLLVGLGLKAYVPVEKRKIVRGHKSIDCTRPLLPGYVFVGAHFEMPWRDVAEIKHFRRWYRHGDGRLVTITDAEVDRVRRRERELNKRLSDRRTFKNGDRVRVQDSVFGTMEWLLTDVISDNHKLEAYVMGKRITMTTGADNLERIV